MSAFSSLETFSPSACRAVTMRSLSSSRQRLMRALLFLSSMGFMTFLYWYVRETGSSSGCACAGGWKAPCGGDIVRAGRIIGARATVCERMARAPTDVPLLCALHRLWQNARDKSRGGTHRNLELIMVLQIIIDING